MITFDPLWRTLHEKNLNKGDLQKLTKLSSTTIAKLAKNPSIPEHYIEFIILETATGYQKKDLKPGEKPEASFAVTEPVVAAYELCNLHGLWMAKA